MQLDLQKAVAGANTFTITEENIVLPPGIGIRRVEPSVVKVILDTTLKKELPVQVDWVGRLPDSLILEQVTLSPEKTTVLGGSRILKDMETVYTEKVPLGTISESGQMAVNLALRPATLKIAAGGRDKVQVSYVIRQRGGHR